jgi:hypothetical protein
MPELKDALEEVHARIVFGAESPLVRPTAALADEDLPRQFCVVLKR